MRVVGCNTENHDVLMSVCVRVVGCNTENHDVLMSGLCEGGRM